MSGHSKWSTIKRAKGIADAKRSNRFTKLGHAIAVAARSGGADPETNFRLRLAIEKAREANMPKDTIERAVIRGTGTGEGIQMEEVTYEGYGPGQIAIMVQALTDNRNRTTSDLRHLFDEHGGSLGAAGSVAWQFDRRGVVRIVKGKLGDRWTEAMELKIIDAGGENIESDEDGVTITADPANLTGISTVFNDAGIAIESVGLEWVPKNTAVVLETNRQSLLTLLETLEAHDDVTETSTNAAL